MLVLAVEACWSILLFPLSIFILLVVWFAGVAELGIASVVGSWCGLCVGCDVLFPFCVVLF